MKQIFNHPYIRFVPLLLASVLAALVYFSKWTGIGPGLVFYAACLIVFPISNILAIYFARKGNRLSAISGLILCYLGFTLNAYLNNPQNLPKNYHYDYQSGISFQSMLSATLCATLFGWAAEIYRKSK